MLRSIFIFQNSVNLNRCQIDTFLIKCILPCEKRFKPSKCTTYLPFDYQFSFRICTIDLKFAFHRGYYWTISWFCNKYMPHIVIKQTKCHLYIDRTRISMMIRQVRTEYLLTPTRKLRILFEADNQFADA